MSAAAQSVLLANKYDDSINPEGWWMSEKLDGVRAYWNGHNFYSRNGNQFIAPKFFTKDLPKQPLDGELWCGRGMFSKALSVVKKTKNPEKFFDDWKYLTYLVFDAPSHGGTYEERVKWLKANINAAKQTTYAAVVGISKCKGRDHLKATLKEVLKKGGEGVMLRKAGSRYENKRSSTLLKVKYFHDEECRVTGKLPGTGRCADMMGKLECELPNGCKFKIGTGFSDAQRKNRKFCKVGSIVTFKYQELSSHGNPRFPVFLRERPDLTWDDVKRNAKTKVPFSMMRQRAPKLKLTKQHSILFSTVPSRDQATGKKVVTDADIDDHADDDVDGAGAADGSGNGAAAAAGGGDDDSDGDAPAPAAASAAPKKKGGAGAGAAAGAGAGAAGAKAGKRACKYGANCFRTNAQHRADFTHPPRANDVDHSLDDPVVDGDGDGDVDVKAAAPASASASAAAAADDDDDVELPADEEADGKKSKAELDAEVDEVSAGVGAKAGSKRGGSARDLAAAAPAGKRAKGNTGAAVAATGADGKPKPACFYGAKCYQRNSAHLARFSHPAPGDAGADAEADEDAKIETLREEAQALKLEARIVRAESGSSEAKDIDAKLSEYFDVGLASDDDEFGGHIGAQQTKENPKPDARARAKAKKAAAAAAAASSSAAAAAAAAKEDDSDDEPTPTPPAAAGAAGAGTAAGAASSGSWGIASDGDDDGEQMTIVVPRKKWEKFQQLKSLLDDVSAAPTATAPATATVAAVAVATTTASAAAGAGAGAKKPTKAPSKTR